MQMSDFGVKLNKTQLINGMPLYVFERPGMPISLRVAFFNGSRFDPPGKEGLAHFAEHMVVSGTEDFPTKHDIGLHIESLGAAFNASTSSDKMDIYLDFADKDDTQQVIDLLDQFIQHSVFDPATIERERGAIMAELAGKKSDPGVYIHRLWKLVAYQQTLLARDTIGSEESLQHIERQDLHEYYTQQLANRRAVIVASGDATADSLAGLFNSSEFINQRRFRDENNPNTTRSRQSPIMTKHYPNSEQTHIAFGFPTVPEDHKDYWPLHVLSRILGSGRTSRLQQKLRNDLGLVYSAHAGIDSWYGSGNIATYTSCKTDNTQRVLDIVADEFKRIIVERVSESELAHKRDYLTKSQQLRMQTSFAWVNYHTSPLLKYPDKDTTIATDLGQINSVTPAQIQSVAQKYFKPEAWYLAICGDVDQRNIAVNF